jgi:hypothetical protein
MNDIFNVRRFGLLFKKLLLEQSLQLFGVLVVAIVLTLLFYKPYNVKTLDIYPNFDIMPGILIISGITLTFFLFSHFSDNAKGYNFLLLPTSFFEKWLSGFLITGVLFFSIYLVFFRVWDSYCVDTFHKELLVQAEKYNPEMVKNYLEKVQIQHFDSPLYKRIFAIFFMMTSGTAICSLYFNKNAFIKIPLSLLGIVSGYIFLHKTVLAAFFNTIEIQDIPNLGLVSFAKGGSIRLPQVYDNFIDVVFYYGLPIILWLIALIRLREKEI